MCRAVHAWCLSRTTSTTWLFVACGSDGVATLAGRADVTELSARLRELFADFKRRPLLQFVKEVEKVRCSHAVLGMSGAAGAKECPPCLQFFTLNKACSGATTQHPSHSHCHYNLVVSRTLFDRTVEVCR
jgi:hypothetical protein